VSFSGVPNGFHASHNGQRDAARDNGIFDGGGAALTLQKNLRNICIGGPLIRPLLVFAEALSQRLPTTAAIKQLRQPWHQDMNLGLHFGQQFTDNFKKLAAKHSQPNTRPQTLAPSES